MREYDVTAAVWIEPVGIWTAQRCVYAAVSDGDTRARPWVQRPKGRVSEGDIGQQQVAATPQLKQMAAGVVELLVQVNSAENDYLTHEINTHTLRLCAVHHASPCASTSPPPVMLKFHTPSPPMKGS